MQKSIPYPYLPPNREILFVKKDHPMMARAIVENQKAFEEHPEINNPTCAVLAKGDQYITLARNGAAHESFCPRAALGFPSGQGYEFCPNHCHPNNHAEAQLIQRAKAEGVQDFSQLDLYLAGHWWLCEPCWSAIIDAGISRVFLTENAFDEFNDQVRQTNGAAGVMRSKLSFFVAGDDAEKFCQALTKVKASCQEKAEQADVVILLPGVTEVEAASKTFDYRKSKSWQEALTRLSIDLEKE